MSASLDGGNDSSVEQESLLRRASKSLHPDSSADADVLSPSVPASVGYLASCMPKFTRLLALALFILTMSLVAPLFVYFERDGIPPFRFAFWRHQVMFMFFLFPTIWEYRKMSQTKRLALWDKNVYLAGLARGLSLAMFVFALYFTSTSRASLFASLDGIFLVVWYYFTSRPVSRMEVVGVLVCFAGLAVCELLTLGLGVGESDKGGLTQLLGDMLAAGCCTFIAYEIVLSNEIRKTDGVPLFSFSFLINFSGLCVFGLLSIMFEGTTPVDFFSWIFDASANSSHFYSIVFIGIVVDAVDLIGFNFAVGEFSPLLISSIQLLEPGVTALASYMLKLEDLPPWNTVLGFVLVTLGISIQTRGEQIREEEEERLEKLKEESEASDEESGHGKALLNGAPSAVQMVELPSLDGADDSLNGTEAGINGHSLVQRSADKLSEAAAVDKIGRSLD